MKDLFLIIVSIVAVGGVAKADLDTLPYFEHERLQKVLRGAKPTLRKAAALLLDSISKHQADLRTKMFCLCPKGRDCLADMIDPQLRQKINVELEDRLMPTSQQCNEFLGRPLRSVIDNYLAMRIHLALGSHQWSNNRHNNFEKVVTYEIDHLISSGQLNQVMGWRQSGVTWGALASLSPFEIQKARQAFNGGRGFASGDYHYRRYLEILDETHEAAFMTLPFTSNLKSRSVLNNQEWREDIYEAHLSLYKISNQLRRQIIARSQNLGIDSVYMFRVPWVKARLMRNAGDSRWIRAGLSELDFHERGKDANQFVWASISGLTCAAIGGVASGGTAALVSGLACAAIAGPASAAFTVYDANQNLIQTQNEIFGSKAGFEAFNNVLELEVDHSDLIWEEYFLLGSFLPAEKALAPLAKGVGQLIKTLLGEEASRVGEYASQQIVSNQAELWIRDSNNQNGRELVCSQLFGIQ